MSAVIVKYHGPGASAQARISVRWHCTSDTKAKFYPWNWQLSEIENYVAAFKEWCRHNRITDDTWVWGAWPRGLIFVRQRERNTVNT